MSRIIAICLAVSLVSGCSGYWSTESSSTSAERTGPSYSYPSFELAGFGWPEVGFYIAVDAACDASWPVRETTTTVERFHSTAKWKLWLALGAMTMVAGAIPLAAGGPEGLGYAMLIGGGAEVGYALPNMFASLRRRTRTTTSESSRSGYGECQQSSFDASQWTLSTPWGESTSGSSMWSDGGDRWYVSFNPILVCATKAECADMHRGEFVISFAGTGDSWSQWLPAEWIYGRYGY